MAKQLFVMLAPFVLLGGCATTPAAPVDDPKLSAAIDGKVAGKPVDCIDLQRARNSEVTRSAILFRDGRNRVFVNAAPGCGGNRLDPILVTRPFGSRLCSGDLVTLVDRGSNIPGPSCALGKFTPYEVAR